MVVGVAFGWGVDGMRFAWAGSSERLGVGVDVASDLGWACWCVVLRALLVVVAAELIGVMVFKQVQVVFEGVVDVDDGLVAEWRGRDGIKAAVGGHGGRLGEGRVEREGAIGADGYNSEETKVIAEMRKIMGLPNLRVGVTCVRVPVLRAHSMAITVEFKDKLAVDASRALLSKAPGVKVVDDRVGNHFPMPVESSGQYDVLVGRIREDLSDPTGHTLAIFISGDQLLKGAALNAVQIAERLV